MAVSSDPAIQRRRRRWLWARGMQLASALTLAITLWSVDWVELRGIEFADLENYVRGFTTGAYNVGSDSASIIQWYTNEYLWSVVVYQLAEHFTVPDIFSWLTLFSLISMTVYVALKATHPIYLLLLVHPVFIDLCFSQTRSAVAVSLIYIALVARKGIVAHILVMISAFVHSAAIVFAGSYLLDTLLINIRWVRSRRVFIALGYLVFSILSLTILRSLILNAIEDRRLAVETTLSGALFMTMIGAYALPFLYQGQFMKRLSAYLAVLAPTLAVAMYFDGQNGVRFVALAMPAIVVASSHLSGNTFKIITICVFVVFQLVYLGFWL